MTEARIECITTEFPLHDLGLRLKKGQVVFIEEVQARASSELTEATRIGAVRVRFVARSRMAKTPDAPKPPPPPNVRLGRRRPLPVPTAPPQSVDMDEIRRVAREEARAGAAEGVREALASMPATLTQDALEATLRRVLPGATAAEPGGIRVAGTSKATGPADPVYIPATIVDNEVTTSITVDAQSSEAGDLDAAAKALKAKRRKPKPETE
jgi:hypothetical protein